MLQRNPGTDEGGTSRKCQELINAWHGIEQGQTARQAQDAVDALKDGELEMVCDCLRTSRTHGYKIRMPEGTAAHVVRAYNLVYDRNCSRALHAFRAKYLQAPVCAQQAFLRRMHMV